MPWWAKSIIVGTLTALGCIVAGFLLASIMPGDKWPFFAVAVLALVFVYLVASSFPRCLAPSHTRRPRCSAGSS